MMFIPMNLDHLTLIEEWLTTPLDPMPGTSAILHHQTVYTSNALAFSNNSGL